MIHSIVISNMFLIWLICLFVCFPSTPRTSPHTRPVPLSFAAFFALWIYSTTPDSGGGSGQTGKGGEDGDQPPTVCTNCQTTNTPLWRRDPEGQPLCTYTFSHSFNLGPVLMRSPPMAGNACGLFYVCFYFRTTHGESAADLVCHRNCMALSDRFL